MRFGWINWLNAVVVAYLMVVNTVAVGKGLAGDFNSRHPAVNALEQAGRYGCMVFMILPIVPPSWKFGFRSVAELCIWVCMTVLLLIIYTVLWAKKSKGGADILYGLAIIPAILFLMNGILLRHPVLIASSLIFGCFHLAIVRENA